MSNDLQKINNTEKLTSFISLSAGQYWKSKVDIPAEGIDAGTVLLICSIKWVDDSPHTIVLSSHPEKIDQYFYYNEIVDGKTIRKTGFYNNHQFLFDDFLAQFEFEPDAQKIRERELAIIQGKISSLQNELRDIQTNPAILSAIVETELTKQDEKKQQEQQKEDHGNADNHEHSPLALLSNDVVDHYSAAAMPVSHMMRSHFDARHIDILKDKIAREGQIAKIKSEWIQKQTQKIADTLKAMSPFYKEQAQAALSATEDVRHYVANLLKGIETLDLYIGKNVSIEVIKKGESAAKDIPLTFVQKKLMMDEEFSLWADIDHNFDFQNQNEFFECLADNDGLITQIFPTERSVVVMATTSRAIEYGDVWVNQIKNSFNAQVFILVRDGDNIYRVNSPVESHMGAARLFPSKTEMGKIFKGFDGRNITLNDIAYTKALSSYETHVLHYKRFLVLMCGLDHRESLFGDFYDKSMPLNMMSLEFQEKYCRFLHDDDGEGLIGGIELKPLHQWIEEKNKYLRSGSRVMCHWSSLMTPKTAPSACKWGRDNSYTRMFQPKNEMDIVVASRIGKDIVVHIDVEGYSYSKGDDRSFQCRVNLSESDTRSTLSYLCLDAVKIEELKAYMHSRHIRANALYYIQLFKQAVRFLETEYQEELPLRQKLRQAMDSGNIGNEKDRDDVIDKVITNYRASNRGKGMPDFSKDDARKEWVSILDSLYLIINESKSDDISEFSEHLGYKPLRLSVANGKYVLYVAPNANERDDRLVPHAWVWRIVLKKSKMYWQVVTKKWSTLAEKSASETTIQQWDDASEWVSTDKTFSSFSEKTKIFSNLDGYIEKIAPFTRQMSESEHDLLSKAWLDKRNELTNRSSRVVSPFLCIPFGLIYDGFELKYLCFGHHHPAVLFYHNAPNDEQKTAFMNAYKKIFRYQDDQERKLLSRERDGFDFFTCPIDSDFLFAEGQNASVFCQKKYYEIQLRHCFEDKMENLKKLHNKKIYLPDNMYQDDKFVFDELVAREIPADYCLTALIYLEVVIRKKGDDDKTYRFFDLIKGIKEEDIIQNGFSNNLRQFPDVKKQFNAPTSISSMIFFKKTIKDAEKEMDTVARNKFNEFEIVNAKDNLHLPSADDGIERWYIIGEKENIKIF